MSRSSTLLCLLLLLPLTACHWQTKPGSGTLNLNSEQRQEAKLQAQALFDEYYQFELEQSPVLRSQLGISGQFEWDDLSAETREQRLEFYQSLRQQLQAIPEQALDANTLANYRTLLERIEQDLLMMPFEQYQYAVTQLGGWHTRVVEVLTNYHPISNLDEARDYITRLNAIPALFNRLRENLRSAEDNGIIAPKFAYDAAIANINHILTGEPFSNPGVSPILADFRSKLNNLGLYSNTTALLERRARTALTSRVQPAYQQLLQFLIEQRERAPEQQTLADLPDGMRYYQLLLIQYSNSHTDANSIHQLGLTEVSRIQHSIRKLLPALGYQGDSDDLATAFIWIEQRTPKFSNDEQGRDEFMGFQRTRVKQMAERLPFYFTTMPIAPIAVRAVEPYRQQGAPTAFYEPPSLDGTRPGQYFVNTARMNDVSRYRLAALAYHEAVPGHHLQIALAQENEKLPAFRRIIINQAFSEGWALYAEKLATEMNAYQGVEEEYGRLVQELWRAARLVVDTGLHARGWSKQQALDYLTHNTPLSKAESEQEINRYLVIPGQAVAYKMGELKLLSIRQQMQDKLGSRFDLPRFHTALLSQGTLPLDVLEEWMHIWANNPNKMEGKRQ